MPDLILRPGARHHPHRAVESGNVEGNARFSVGTDFDDAGIARQRLLRRLLGTDLAAGIAAGADHAAHALHPVDQIAVEIAYLARKLPLTEEILVRIRRLVVR